MPDQSSLGKIVFNQVPLVPSIPAPHIESLELIYPPLLKFCTRFQCLGVLEPQVSPVQSFIHRNKIPPLPGFSKQQFEGYMGSDIEGHVC